MMNDHAAATGLPRSRVPPFSRLAILWMVGVGVVSGLMFLILTAYAPDLRNRSDGGAHALSKSAVGYSGLLVLLKTEGTPVLTSRSLHPEHEQKGSLLVLTPNLASDLKTVTAANEPGARLLVLPKWMTGPDQSHPGWVIGAKPAPLPAVAKLMNLLDKGDHMVRRSGRAAPVLKRLQSDGAIVATIPAGQITNLQTMKGPDHGWISVIVDQYGETVLARGAGTSTYILSDPDLLNNQGLAQLANAEAASAIIDALRAGRPVTFDLALAGFARTRSLVRLAFEPPFLSATLCAFAAAVLIGMHAGVRFGAPARNTRAFALGKQALVDNSAALIRLVKREHHMGQGYAALIRTLTLRAVSAPRDLSGAQTDALLDRLGHARNTQDAFTDLERQAQEARDGTSLMRAARKLYQWRLEMTRDRN